MKIAIVDTLGLTYDGTTLEKRGLGGSESAVILLSKQLAALGFTVDVYCSCIDSEATPGTYDGVTYIDHSQPESHGADYDVFISSRSVAPFMSGNLYVNMALSSAHRVMWMHDTFCQGDEHLEAMLNSNYIHEVFTLSDFHYTYVTTNAHGAQRRMQETVKHKFWQTRNGAVDWLGEVDVSKKDRNHFVYNASASKGLLPLLKNIWPELKKQIPSARLTCIGGYYRFRDNAQPDAQEQTVRELMQDQQLAQLGVEFTGVIPQKQIAEILATAGFMLYPPAFPETFGISTLESMLYRTPVITGRFGALEETAVDDACYKINYPAVPNSLYPNIDEANQTRLFVKTAVDAYNNTYLHQQKQYACDRVKSVAGWDTIALQWKQHFYQVSGKTLSRDEYRRVSRINRDVARIFGRRVDTPEQRNQYHSYGAEHSILIISPFWNSADYIEKCIHSVAQQDYDNYHHVLVNDASSDSSYDIALATIQQLPKDIQQKFELISNTENKGAIYNQIQLLDRHAAEYDVVMLLDGDDWLVNNNSLFHYYNDLYHQGYDFTYGSMHSIADNIPLIAQDYPKAVQQDKTYKQHKFNWGIPYTHLRTFSSKLCSNIDHSVFKSSNGQWMRAGADNPLFYELIERANSPLAVKEIVCNYNDANPLNDYKVRAQEQNTNATQHLQRTNKMSASKIKTILVGIPTNKYIEPETFKSIFDLEVPSGYKLEFQTFFGYRIDQIRNLIADWAKRYDYLLSVDSDIVLPRDSLKKMLAADVDIISGLYIQRIPGTQTVELYQDNQAGGVSNIPYRRLEDVGGIVEVAACGFGAVLIKSNVFREMEYPHFVYASALDHRNAVSEDVFFCNRARAAGFKVWADTSIKCNHIGQTVFSVDTQEQQFLRKIHNQDLLPAAHVEYLAKMNITPRVVYDIGSCVLHWTEKAQHVWPDAEYYVFDALKEAEFLYKEKQLNYHLGILTDTDNKNIKFYKDVFNAGGNSYYKENSIHYNESHAVAEVGMTLDTVVQQRQWPVPDLIKIDVQGAELDIIKGAAHTLLHCDNIILEAQHVDYNAGAPKVQQVIDYMQSIGFELVAKFAIGEVDGDYHFTRTKQ